MKSILAVSVLCLATVCLADNDGVNLSVKKPFNQERSGRTSAPPQILYHGGKVLGTNGLPVPVYVIYYGNLFPSTTQPIIDTFIRGLSTGVNVITSTPPFVVNSSYCEASVTNCPSPGNNSKTISGLLNYVESVNMPPTEGTDINNTGISRILKSALATGVLPVDDTAIYTLITDPTIKVTGFPNSFCAYHTHSNSIVSGHDIHYALAPEPAAVGACDGNFANGQTVTPNGDAGADEITDSLMHEFSETVSDPDINAWYTSNGEENGDLCNYNYGTWLSLPQAGNGATYNTLIAGAPYLLQLIWLNKPLPQYCAPAR